MLKLCECKGKFFQVHESKKAESRITSIKFIVYTPPFCWGVGGGRVSLRQNFQKEGGLRGSHFLEGGCWERGGDFFQGRTFFNLYMKKNLKSEIFINKKAYKQKCFSLT